MMKENGNVYVSEDESQLCDEVKAFVKSCILLREVEKKVIG